MTAKLNALERESRELRQADLDLHRFRSGRVLMLGGLLFESHG